MSSFGKQIGKGVDVDYINVGESYWFQYLEVLVLCDDILGVRMNGAINEFIVVNILFNKSETIYGVDVLGVIRR